MSEKVPVVICFSCRRGMWTMKDFMKKVLPVEAGVICPHCQRLFLIIDEDTPELKYGTLPSDLEIVDVEAAQ